MALSKNVGKRFGILLTYWINFSRSEKKTSSLFAHLIKIFVPLQANSISGKNIMPEYDITIELARLHILNGADFVRQLKMLTQFSIFKPVENEKDIFAAEGSHREDFPMLLDAARKAVQHGNKVFILPNPKGIRTADFIFENKGIFKMYDLKTISGKASLENRLMESIGQANHVLINVCTKYSPRLMATQIRNYFQYNPDALETLIFKGRKAISVKRKWSESQDFYVTFRRLYEK